MNKDNLTYKQFLNEIKNYRSGNDDACVVKYVFCNNTETKKFKLPEFVISELEDIGIVLNEKCVIEYNHRKIQALKRGWCNKGNYARWEYDEEKYWRDLVAIFYVNEIVQMNLRATCIAAKELIRLFRTQKFTDEEIIEKAEKVGQRVLIARENNTEEYQKALIPDSLSERAKKFKYNKEIINIAEQAYRYRVDRERIPSKLDKIIIDCLIEDIWNECITDDEVIDKLFDKWKVRISRGKFYSWRREHKENEHKQRKQHKQHEKTKQQKAKEETKVKENAATIVNLKKEYGKEWKKHWTSAEQKYCYRHKEDIEYYVAYFTDVLTVARKIDEYRKNFGVWNWMNNIDESWKEAYLNMQEDIDKLLREQSLYGLLLN